MTPATLVFLRLQEFARTLSPFSRFSVNQSTRLTPSLYLYIVVGLSIAASLCARTAKFIKSTLQNKPAPSVSNHITITTLIGLNLKIIDIMSYTRDDLVAELLRANCLKFGEFTLKSGATSDYYIDLRESTLHPPLFKCIVEAVKSVISSESDLADQRIAIVGVPYGVVPIAAAVAYQLGLPYYPVRKETKDHGRETDADSLSDHCFVLIEDVMSSGSSIMETIQKLNGKRLTDVVVVANRMAGGLEKLKLGYPDIRVHSILKASDLLRAKAQ